MATLVTDYAFTKTRCSLGTRLGLYRILLFSLPRAVVRAGKGLFTIDSANPYQSLSLRNIASAYRGVPGMPLVACLVALMARAACLFVSKTEVR